MLNSKTNEKRDMVRSMHVKQVNVLPMGIHSMGLRTRRIKVK